MNKRATTWLLAAFLALSAGAAVPVTRAQARGGEVAIVWVAQNRAERRIIVQRRSPARVRQTAVSPPVDPQAKIRLFAAFLYQRPPPFFLR